MVIISLSVVHQKVRFDCVFSMQIPLFHEKNLSILTCLELILKGFSNPALLMSCQQGPFGSWKYDFLIFIKPLIRLSCPQGPLGSCKFDFFHCSTHYSSLFTLISSYFPLFPLISPYFPLFAFIYP